MVRGGEQTFHVGQQGDFDADPDRDFDLAKR